ncbi:MAG TPA: IS1380 family transposase [Acidimicrobiales bacterium]|nr:IS1380 family transposase [Acidimicrobiales bacterium]
MRSVSRGIDRIAVTFDEPGLVANAGLLLIATLVKHLDLEAVVDTMVRIPSKRGGFAPGRKVLTLVHAMVAGATHIDHAEMLRAGATEEVLSHRVMAPSTLGTFLRGFTFGHVRQLEAVVGEILRRAWSVLVLPARLVVDVDSTICEVAGKQKAGAAYGYTKVLGLHPLLATRADTGELLHARLRKGSANTQRGAKRFIEELVARLRRAGATGTLVMRFDSGFWSKDILCTLERLKVSYTMAVRAGTKAIAQVIATIAEEDWVRIVYPEGGEAAVAETTYKGRRLVVRRTRLVGPQAALWPDWRHFAFLTDLSAPAVEIDAFHRERAQAELDIKDLKEGAGMEHCPSGSFSANAAWLQCAVLAHNLLRWTQLMGGLHDHDGHRPAVARTIRTRFVSLPGRLVNRSGTPTLRGPSHWPWRVSFTSALSKLRALPATVT